MSLFGMIACDHDGIRGIKAVPIGKDPARMAIRLLPPDTSSKTNSLGTSSEVLELLAENPFLPLFALRTAD